MIVTLPASEHPERLLVRSDLPDPISARREVGSWASSRGIAVPRLALRLRVVSGQGDAREWTLVERPAEALPSPEEAPSQPQRPPVRRKPSEGRPLPDFLQLVRGAA